MERFRRKDARTLFELTALLQTSGKRVLLGESKLSLTTHSLGLLYQSFQGLAEIAAADQSLKKKKSPEFDQLCKDVTYLQDFLNKAKSVKIIHRSVTIQGRIQIGYLDALEWLEIKKVPIHLVEGMQKLRPHLKKITCARCIQHLQDLFETCGGDMSPPLTWPRLKEACLSYNGISRLDSSLRLMPVLEALDLSHNNLEEVDNHLQYLTELVHINLGFNQLSMVAQFSLSARSKLRTLILRNNTLEHLEGLEELVTLEELDVANNCLSEHSCLDVLTYLDKLSLLCLCDNPLSYHRSHRSLTLQHISPVAAKSQFELDGKQITDAERLITVRKRVHRSPSRRPSQLAHKVLSNTQSMISNNYTFSDSDAIAKSVPVSPGQRRAKKGKTKFRTRSKKALIAEFESSTDTYTTGISSRDSSRAPSPSGKKNKLPKTKEEYEVLRDHYGPDWLRAYNTKPGQSNIQRTLEQAASMTEDDIYLNESETGIGSVSHEDDIKAFKKESKLADEESVFPANPTAATKGADIVDGQDSGHLERMDSAHGIEWKRTDSEQIDYHGPESEPFIAMLAEPGRPQLFLTLNNRYLLEKDINGELREMLDLQLLETLHSTTEAHNVEGCEEGVHMPVIHLTFGYVRKDRRERTYIMEDEENAENFESILRPKLEAKKLSEILKEQLQCLKCSVQFLKSDARKTVKGVGGNAGEHLYSSSAGTVQQGIHHESFTCPKCGSDLVVEMEVLQPGRSPHSASITPVGSLPTSGELRPQVTSTPWKQKDQGISVVTADSKGQLRRSLEPKFQTEMAVGHGIQSGKISDLKRASLPAVMPLSAVRPNTWKPFGRGNEDKPDLPNMAEINVERTGDVASGTNVYQVSGSLDHERGVLAKELQARLESLGPKKESKGTDFRSRMNSTGSDIAILSNPSEGSMSLLSEGSQELGTAGLEREDEPIKTSGLAGRNFSPILERSASCDEGRTILSGNSVSSSSSASPEKGRNKEIAPSHSPLSMSVCNSMVSSVYENSISVSTGQTQIPVDSGVSTDQTGDSQISLLVDEIKVEGDISIYDSLSGSRTPQIYQGLSVSPASKDFISGSLSSFSAQYLTPSTTSPTSPSYPQQNESSSNVIDTYSGSLPQTDSSLANGSSREVEGSGISADVTESECCQMDFSLLDHRLKLYFDVSLLKQSAEECLCMLECSVVQYMIKEEFVGILLLSSDNFYVLKVLPQMKRKKPDDCKSWLKCIEVQPISELQHIDLGLGGQSFRLEFDTDCSSYSFIIRDQPKCEAFLQVLKEHLLTSRFNMQTVLDDMRRDDLTTLENLYHQVVVSADELDGDDVLEAGEEPSRTPHYIMGYLVKDTVQEPVSFVVTQTDICLVQENHQWPLPRLQAPLSEDIKGLQFVVKERQKINNIVQIDFLEDNLKQVKILFFIEESGEELYWHVAMETTKGVQSLVSWVKDPWESEFGVDLEISWLSFTSETT